MSRSILAVRRVLALQHTQGALGGHGARQSLQGLEIRSWSRPEGLVDTHTHTAATGVENLSSAKVLKVLEMVHGGSYLQGLAVLAGPPLALLALLWVRQSLKVTQQQ